MKTKITIASLLSILFFSTVGFADNFKVKEEAYIDDIPFNTYEVYLDYAATVDGLTATLKMEEESYIDDIPFDTEHIADSILAEEAMEEVFEMPEEASIDDIPFDTHDIAESYIRKMYHAETKHFGCN